MSRYASSSMQALSQLGIVAHRYLADIQVSSSTLHACNGYKPLSAFGNLYLPVGNGEMAGVDIIQEESDPFPRGLKMWIAAVNSAQLYEPLTENLFNKSVTLYDAFLDPNTFTLVGTPEPVFAGRMNEIEIKLNDSQKGPHYEVSIETELRREPPVAYFNKETLWANYSGDTFFNLQHMIPTTRAMWGQQPTNFTNFPGYQPNTGPDRDRGGGGGRFKP